MTLLEACSAPARLEVSAPLSREDLQALIAARRPGFSLPQPFYTDEALFRTDLELIFGRFWLYAGHISQIPKPGDFFTWQVGRDPIVIVRGENGAIRAHYNVCPHRGSLLCNTPSGHAKKLVCPYHQWIFDANGQLLSARHMPADFDKASYGLRPVHVRLLAGLIFISLAENPPDFQPVIDQIAPFTDGYDMEQTKIACGQRYEVHANWKLIAENFRECYHCAGGHPEYCRIVLGAGTDHPVYSKDKHTDVWKSREAHWRQSGLKTGSVPFTEKTWHHCARYPFRGSAVSQTLDGEPCGPLLGRLTDRDAGVFAIVTYPNFWHESSSDYFMTLRVTPLSATRCEVLVHWHVRADAVEGRDYDPARVSAFWRATGEQDYKLAEDNQAGILSNQYKPGPYGPLETEIELFIKWYLEQLRARF